MIDLISSEQVQELIEQRKQIFKLNGYYYVFTPLNHVFWFWTDGSISLFDINGYKDYKPEIAKLYGVEYGSSSGAHFRHPTTRKHLYDLFISDPECMFTYDWNELEQEIQHRGLR